MDNCTFLPAEHRALLSTFSQVIYMTPTSFRQLSNHQNHSRGFSFGTCTKTQSVDVCKYAKIKMHTHTLLAPRPPSLSGHSQGQRRTHAPLNSALAIDERYCPELSSPWRSSRKFSSRPRSFDQLGKKSSSPRCHQEPRLTHRVKRIKSLPYFLLSSHIHQQIPCTGSTLLF